MTKGDVLGHEPMGIVEEVGSAAYDTFQKKQDGAVKIVFQPGRAERPLMVEG